MMGPSPAASAAAAAHAYVDDVEAPVLVPEDRHHLERVLRLRVGDALTVADGRGAWRSCALAGGGRLDPLDAVHHLAAPEPALGVALAVTKGTRPEVAVQKLTEVGVDTITLFHAQRSVARWEGERADRHLERLARVSHGRPACSPGGRGCPR